LFTNTFYNFDVSKIPGDQNYLSLIVYSVIGSWFIALSSQASVHLPKNISMVPITMQTLAINLLSLFFSWQIALTASILYYVQIAIGLPFGADGQGGKYKLISPSGGYLIGFIIASFQISYMFHNQPKQTILFACSIMLLGSVIIYVCGLLWLPFGLYLKHNGRKSISEIMGNTKLLFWKNLLMWGCIPFIPGDLLKVVLSLFLYFLYVRIVSDISYVQA